MPKPIWQIDPLLGSEAPLPPRPILANDGPPEITPTADRPACNTPLATPTRPTEPPPSAPLVHSPEAKADAPPPAPRHATQRAAFDALRLALAEGHVFGALTGPAGAGKTAVLDAVLADLPGRKLRTIRIAEASRVSAKLAAQIEEVAYAAAKQANADLHVVLAVDDAHAASDELLRALTRLAAAGRPGQRLPQIFLVGRPELWSRLTTEDYKPLVARLAIRPVLPAAIPPAAIPEDPWAPIEQQLARMRDRVEAGAARGPDRASDAQAVAPPSTLSGLTTLLAQDTPSFAELEGRRRRGRFLLPFAVLLTVGGGLYMLSWFDWPPQRLANVVWAGARRYIPASPQRPSADAADHPAQMEQPSKSVPLEQGSAVTVVPAPEPQVIASARPQPAPAVKITPPPASTSAGNTEAPLSNGAQDGVASVTSAGSMATAEEVRPVPDGDGAPLGRDASAGAKSLSGPRAADRAVPPAAPAEPQQAGPAGPVREPAPPPAVEPADTSSPRPEIQPSAAAPSAPPEFVALLLRRGDERLALGDLSAARLFYERAVASGSARGARLAARTYDRAYLNPATADLTANKEAALTWYRRAATLGDAEATERLRQLETER